MSIFSFLSAKKAAKESAPSIGTYRIVPHPDKPAGWWLLQRWDYDYFSGSMPFWLSVLACQDKGRLTAYVEHMKTPAEYL